MPRARNLLDFREHSRLQDLVHELIQDSFTELTYSAGQVSTVIAWTDSGKTTKIREASITYSGGLVSTVAVTQYGGSDPDDIPDETITYTFTYSGGNVASIDAVVS